MDERTTTRMATCPIVLGFEHDGTLIMCLEPVTKPRGPWCDPHLASGDEGLLNIHSVPRKVLIESLAAGYRYHKPALLSGDETEVAEAMAHLITLCTAFTEKRDLVNASRIWRTATKEVVRVLELEYDKIQVAQAEAEERVTIPAGIVVRRRRTTKATIATGAVDGAKRMLDVARKLYTEEKHG